jgi:enoyl-CoA hydratase/carnithine racemase
VPLLITDASGVRTLTLSNPAKRNALTREVLSAIPSSLPASHVGDGQPIHVVVLKGDSAGRAFSSGFDIHAITPSERAQGLDPIAPAADALTRCPVPVIACIDGPCMGGAFELAMACSFRVASHDATFCMPPARLGLAYSTPGLERQRHGLSVSHRRGCGRRASA